MAIKNEVRVVTIIDQGKTGDGIGILDDLPVYISNCIPGDLVQVKLIKIEKRRMYGKLLEILESSEDRVSPKCLVASQCGGCQLQHQSHGAQLGFKQQLMLARLGRFISFDLGIVQTMVPAQQLYGFRNKMQFSFGFKANQLQIGLYASRSHRVVNTMDCPIMSPQMNQVLYLFRKWHSRFLVPVYDESDGSGVLRHLTIRYSLACKELMIIITVAKPMLHLDALINELTQLDGLACVFISTQSDASNDSVLGSQLDCVWGGERRTLNGELNGITYQISPRSFVQANEQMMPTLYQTLVSHLDWKGDGTLIDLYCGIGLLTMMLAKTGGTVIGVDDNKSAIEDATMNAKNNQLTIDFICQKAETFLGDYDCSDSVLVMDPPRQGCHPSVLRSIIQAAPKLIGIISCHADSLGRDLRLLVDGGYDINSIQGVEMFPHSVHLEMVVCLRLRM